MKQPLKEEVRETRAPIDETAVKAPEKHDSQTR